MSVVRIGAALQWRIVAPVVGVTGRALPTELIPTRTLLTKGPIRCEPVFGAAKSARGSTK